MCLKKIIERKQYIYVQINQKVHEIFQSSYKELQNARNKKY